MAIRDWPDGREYMPAEMTLGLDVSELVHVGFRTGNRTRQSNLVDRLTCQMTLPPCFGAEGTQREAFLLNLRSTGDYVRMPMPHRRSGSGSIWGNPVVRVALVAGARTLQLGAVRQPPNLLAYVESFDNAVWTASGGATVIANTFPRPGSAAVRADTVTDSSTSAQAYIEQVVPVPDDTATYTASIYVRRTTGGTAPTVRLLMRFQGGTVSQGFVDFNTDTGVLLAGASAGTVEASTDWWRISRTFANNGSGNTQLAVRFFPAIAPYNSATATNSVTGSAVVWGAQLESGAVMTPLQWVARMFAGDLIQAGDNLLMVSQTATVGSDGNMTVPLALPAPAAVEASTTVIVERPAGVWELDTDVIDMAYSPGSTGPYQRPLVVRLRQAVM